MGEQTKGNSYEIEVEEGKWNRRSYVVLLYGGTEEGKQLRNRSRRREMEQMKLCSTPVQRNRRRKTVKIEVEEGKWNRRSHVVILYGGIEEGKQL